MAQTSTEKQRTDGLADAGVVIFEDPGDVGDLLAEAGVALKTGPPAAPKGDPFEQLVARGLIGAKDLKKARKLQKDNPRESLQSILIRQGACTEEDYLKVVAEQYGLPFRRLTRADINEQAFGTFTLEYVQKNHVIGIQREPGRIIVGLADPANVFLIEEIRRVTGLEVEVVVVTAGDIGKVVEEIRSGGEDFQVDDIIKDIEEDSVEVVDIQTEEVTDLEKVAGESPVIRFVNYLIFNAVKEGASDIHIEPGENRTRVRHRIDGVLFEALSPPHSMHAAVISRLKIMATLDISERRLPQDGRIRAMVYGRHVDLRVSTLPTTWGEKCVIRILDNRSILLGLEQLGLSEDMLAIFSKQIQRPNGIILVTGPTGSGKTTTLYSALQTMDGNSLNISTVEDPVEYQLSFASQVQINDKIGLSFAACLRSLLRQDPDVIMVGEIRDEDTSRIAVQASLTGHLVLSTLHTNDAPSTVTRLINIGIEPYLIAASVNAVLAQRLVRRICEKCKTQYEPSDEMKWLMDVQGFKADKLTHGEGCEKCRNTGYHGRTGLYEMLILDDVTRDLVTRNPSVTELRKTVKERGMVSLREDGFDKVARGITTIEEVVRVTEEVV
jgi:type IV pilus assembly protein PilB